MHIKLKQNQVFTNPETGEDYNELTGGVTNVNIDTRNKRYNFLVKFNKTRELMEQGKQPSYKQAFSIQDTEEKADFTAFYTRTTGNMLGVEIEKAMYEFVLSEKGFEVFEIII